MNAQPLLARCAALLGALIAAACSSSDPNAGAATPRQTATLPVHAALIFSGPFRWVERDQAFAAAGGQGQPGPVGLDQPLRPLATLHWPTCPAARPINQSAGLHVLTDRLTKPETQCRSTVRFGIAEDGRVNHLQLIHSAPTVDFGHSVINTLTQWRFEPPLRGGKPADICCVELRID